MTKNLLLISFILLSFSAFSQNNGSLSGYIYSSLDKQSIPGANVFVKTINGIVGTVTDSAGHFTIKPLKPGHYTLNISFVGYTSAQLNDVIVGADFDTEIKKTFLQPGIGMDTVVIRGNGRKMINKNGGNIITMDPKEQRRLPNPRNTMSVVAMISTEFYVSDNQKEVHFRGSRNDMTAYIIDGVRTENTEGIPGLAIGNMTVYAGGIPARYGDFTGGCVVIETMGYYDWLAMQKSRDRLYQETSIP